MMNTPTPIVATSTFSKRLLFIKPNTRITLHFTPGEFLGLREEGGAYYVDMVKLEGAVDMDCHFTVIGHDSSVPFERKSLGKPLGYIVGLGYVFGSCFA